MTVTRYRALLIAVTLFLPATVFANFNGLEPLALRPSSDSVHFFHVHDAYTLPPYYFNLGLQADLALDSTTLTVNNNPADVGDEFFYLNLLASMGILENLSAGIGLPISVQQFRDDSKSTAVMASEGLSEVHLNAKWRFFDERDYLPGLAFVPSVNIPVYARNQLVGSRLPVLNLELAVSKRIGSEFHSSFNLGYRLRERHVFNEGAGSVIDDQMIYSVGLNYEITPLNSWIITELHGSTVVSKFWQDATHSPLELVAGPRYRATPNLTLSAGAGVGLVKGIGDAKWRVFTLMTFNFNTRDIIKRLIISKHRIELPERIYFEFNSDKIEERSYNLLRDIAAVITGTRDLKAVILEGHTDSIGSDEYNLKLSGRRVESVREFLVNLGIPPRMIVAKTYGKRYPITTNETEEGRAINRRVEFRVVMEYESVKEVFERPPDDPYFETPAASQPK